MRFERSICLGEGRSLLKGEKRDDGMETHLCRFTEAVFGDHENTTKCRYILSITFHYTTMQHICPLGKCALKHMGEIN